MRVDMHTCMNMNVHVCTYLYKKKMRLYELYDYVQRCENFSGVDLH